MKKDKEQRTNLLLIIFAPISTVAGIPFLVIPIENVQRSMRIMFGGATHTFGLVFILAVADPRSCYEINRKR